MTGKNALIMLAATAALTILGAGAIAAKDSTDDRLESGGSVRPCSLDGVNPVQHPEIFGNPAVAAREFGFVKSRDGAWQVQDNCQTRSQTQGLPESKKR